MERATHHWSRSGSTTVEWLAVAVFLTTAGLLVLTPASPLPIEPTPAVSDEAITTDPMRERLSDPPLVHLGGFKRDCQDCHALFASGDQIPDQRFQHQEIVLDHGLNDSCYNCHDQENRNRLRLHAGQTTTFDQSSLLCAQCHGTTYRDWRDGMHGKTMGAWNSDDPRHRRLACVECHDPHHPAFAAIAPLPGPRTLRMGEPLHHVGEQRSPLMQWHEVLEQHERLDAEEDHE